MRSAVPHRRRAAALQDPARVARRYLPTWAELVARMGEDPTPYSQILMECRQHCCNDCCGATGNNTGAFAGHSPREVSRSESLIETAGTTGQGASAPAAGRAEGLCRVSPAETAAWSWKEAAPRLGRRPQRLPRSVHIAGTSEEGAGVARRLSHVLDRYQRLARATPGSGAVG